MHIVEIGLSFIEGLALIASPCILPVLPLVLSTSVDGGHKRPFGIISGFIIAFTIFALLSRELISIFHFNLDYIKYGSLALLILLGITMLSETLFNEFNKITQNLATVGTTLSSNAGQGYLSGVFIGILIGLVWTPCAGPVLAAALVQIIRQQNNLSAFFLIIAFAVGAGLPMLIIALTGRKIINKLKIFNTHSSIVHKVLGTLILVTAVFIGSNFGSATILASAPTAPEYVANTVLGDKLQNALDTPYQAPEFALNEEWLNTPNNAPLTIKDLKGKVVLIDFWTYSCINCLRTLPYINSWYSKYADKGLVIVGVHAPEFEFEKNKANVISAISRYNIKYPVVLDNNLDTWANYNNQYWPAHYLIDQTGKVVYTSFGEGEYDITENNIRVLLGLNRTAASNNNAPAYDPNQTAETYLGYLRAENFASSQLTGHDTPTEYTFPSILQSNNWAISGNWILQGQKITSNSPNTKLELNFTAKHVYLVLGNSTGSPIDLTLKLNGKVVDKNNAGKDATAGVVRVDSHRLYELINQDNTASGLLEIDVPTSGLEAYAFTFG